MSIKTLRRTISSGRVRNRLSLSAEQAASGPCRGAIDPDRTAVRACISQMSLTKERVVPASSVVLGWPPWRPARQFEDGRYGDPAAVGHAALRAGSRGGPMRGDAC